MKEKYKDYFPGKGCKCAAWSYMDCACSDVDWTPKEVYVLRARIKELNVENNRLRGERCYICRSDDKRASEEGCADCEEKSDLNQSIIAARSRLKVLEDELIRLKDVVGEADIKLIENALRELEKEEKA